MKKLILAAIVMASALTANAQSVQQDCCKDKAKKECCKEQKECKADKKCKNDKKCDNCKEMKAACKKTDAQTAATAQNAKAKAPKNEAVKKTTSKTPSKRIIKK
ncbi:MAG: hypothetical protein MJZ29_10620 [Bacteroidaceae bacterium]|nr:hypothetical protein [Bacteroidaceae bacterium]